MRTTEPNVITQGEQVEWRRSFCDHPATEWTIEYRFRGVGPGKNVAGTADGSGFVMTLLAADSAGFDPGAYQWQAWATEIADTNNTVKVDSGSVTVERGFLSSETGDIDLRTPAKIILDTLDAAIAGSATSSQLEFEVSTPAGTTRIKRMSAVDLNSARKYWAEIVSRENTAARLKNGGRFGKPIKVRMRTS